MIHERKPWPPNPPDDQGFTSSLPAMRACAASINVAKIANPTLCAALPGWTEGTGCVYHEGANCSTHVDLWPSPDDMNLWVAQVVYQSYTVSVLGGSISGTPAVIGYSEDLDPSVALDDALQSARVAVIEMATALGLYTPNPP
jgi:hypothetical protein